MQNAGLNPFFTPIFEFHLDLSAEAVLPDFVNTLLKPKNFSDINSALNKQHFDENFCNLHTTKAVLAIKLVFKL